MRKAKFVLCFIFVLGGIVLLFNDQTGAGDLGQYSTVIFDQRTQVVYNNDGSVDHVCFNCDFDPAGECSSPQGECENGWRQGTFGSLYLCDGMPGPTATCVDMSKLGPKSGCVAYNWPAICCWWY